MVDADQMLNKLLLIAKDDRAGIPYSKDEGFMPKLMFIGPNDEVAISPAVWKDEADKYAMMARAAEAARLTFTQAIVLVSDTRWLQSDVFCEHFKITPPMSSSDDDVKVFQKRYYAILREHGGQIKNLPRQLWNEAVMVAIKGPRCGTHSVMAPYIQGPGDKVQYLPCDKKPLNQDGDTFKAQMNLIPEWWH